MGKIVKAVAILYFIALCSCQGTKTPKEFLYNVNINRTTYFSDSLYLKKLFTQILSKNIRPFHRKDIYDQNSILYIDTILYSPKLEKMVVFVITKNALSKFDRYNHDTTKYLYKGFFFFLYKNIKHEIVANKNCVFTFEADSKEDVKDAFYSYAFIRKSTDHPFAGESQYNMNDIRLWSSKQMEFEMKDSTNLVILEKDTIQFLNR